MQAPVPARRKPRAVLPWVALLAALVLAAYPLARLMPMARNQLAVREASKPGFSVRFGPVEEVGQSDRFRVLGPRNYLRQEEIAALLQRAEAQRTRLMETLALPDDDRRVTIHLRPETGVPRGTGDNVILYAYHSGRTDFVHELTHILTGYNQAFLAEGLAVAMEDRFGWGLSYATGGRPLGAVVGAAELASGLPPLVELSAWRSLWDPREPGTSMQRYAQAGSFTEYLIDSFGLEKWFALYAGAPVRADYVGTYGKTLAELDLEWRAGARRVGLLYLGILMSISLLALSVMFKAGTVGGVRWVVAAVAGLAQAAWAFYLAWPRLALAAPIGLICALALSLFSKRTTRAQG